MNPRTRSEQMAKDESYHGAADGLFPPQAVVFPRTTEEVAEIVRVCLAHRTPIVPSGACTSLEGHLAALRGGVSVNFRDMAAVLAVNQEDMDCRVQAGCTRKALNEHLRDTGLFFPIDPGADASLGGMASTRASGTNAVRYGTMRENVLGAPALSFPPPRVPPVLPPLRRRSALPPAAARHSPHPLLPQGSRP